MKKLYIVVIILFFGAKVFGQNPTMQWGLTFGGSGTDVVNSIAHDGQGNIYAGGTFAGEADFDPGAASVSRSSIFDSDDGFVAKFNSAGELLWVTTFGGADSDAVIGVAADATGVYVTGSFRGTVDFDPVGTNNRSSTAISDDDIFVAKYASANGNLLFVNSVGSNLSDIGVSITLDANSNVYLAGAFQNTISLDPLSAAGDETSWGYYDMFLAKYSSSGTFLWSNHMGSLGEDAALSVRVLGTSVWVGGYFSGPEFHADPNSDPVVLTNLGDFDGYYGKYDAATGNLIIGGSVRSTGADIIKCVEADVNGIYFGGNFAGSAEIFGDLGTSTTILSNGAQDAFAVRLNPDSHELLWANAFGSFDNDYVKGIAVSAGNVLVAGTSPNTMDVDPSSAVVELESQNLDFKSFLVKYNWQHGDYVDAYSFGDNGNAEPFAIINASGIVYWAGIFSGTGVDVDPGDGVDARTSDGFDMFLERLNPVEPPDPPTNLVFDSVTEDLVEYSFEEPDYMADGYITFYRIGSAPTAVPEDGVAYDAGQTVGDSKVLHSFTGDFEEFETIAGTRYFLAIYPFNGTPGKANYSSTALTGDVTTPGGVTDIEPPTIADQSPTSTAPGTKITIVANVTDASGIDEVSVTYYPINSLRQGFGTMALMAGSTNVYTYEIEASFNTEQGVEYAIQADDNVGNRAETPFKSVIVQHDGTGLAIPYTAGTAQENYRIISVPLNLKQKTVADVFADDLGPYDKAKYRLFRYNSGSTSELTTTSPIEAGRGYWFIAAESKPLNSGPGTTVVVGDGKPYTIAITNGWNQIGNPYNFDLDWNLVRDHPDNEDKTFGSLKSYEGAFNDATTLRKMSGAFAWFTASGNGQLRMPVYNDGGRIVSPAPPVNFQQSIASGTWGVDLLLRSGQFKNSFAGFGMHPAASEQGDIYDDFTLPRFMEYLELNYNKKMYGAAFTKDIVPTSTQHTWEFEVESNLPDEIVEITWDNSFFGSTDLELVLWDVQQQRAIDMKTGRSYTFERSQSHLFRIFFGSEEFVSKETLPFRPVFHSASPVPSAGNITFAFSVPESAGEAKTSLVVYNMMGQKVANLVDNALPAGYQQAVWNIEDGTRPAAGVYISVLKFGNTTLQKRLIIK